MPIMEIEPLNLSPVTAIFHVCMACFIHVSNKCQQFKRRLVCTALSRNGNVKKTQKKGRLSVPIILTAWKYWTQVVLDVLVPQANSYSVLHYINITLKKYEKNYIYIIVIIYIYIIFIYINITWLTHINLMHNITTPVLDNISRVIVNQCTPKETWSVKEHAAASPWTLVGCVG